MATLRDIEEILGVKVELVERLQYFQASLPGCDVKDHKTAGTIQGCVAYGSTPKNARMRLAATLRKRLVVQNAWNKWSRVETQMPSRITTR